MWDRRREFMEVIANQGDIPYLLRDDFTDTLAAGATNGTKATDGVNTRVDTDTESKLSQADGSLVFAGGKAAPAWGDPGRAYDARARALGQLLGARVTLPATDKDMKIGWRTSTTGNPSNGVLQFTTGAVIKACDGSIIPQIGVYAINTPYYPVIAQRAAGQFYFIQGGAFSDFRLLFQSITDGNATLYPRIANFNSAGQVDWIKIPELLRYVPAPIASDSFNRADGAIGNTDGAGHAESTGLGAGGSGKAWTNQEGTIAIAANKAQATALDGTTGQAIATIDAGKQDVIVSVTLARANGNVGLIMRFEDADDYVRVYYDGTNVVWQNRLGGVDDAPSNVAKAFGAGNLQLMFVGTDLNIVWNTEKIGPTRTILNKPINDPTASNHFGLYTTDLGNTFDNFTVYPVGTFGEHASLNSYFGIAMSRMVVFDGNSLTAGTTPVTHSYPAQCLVTLGNTYVGHNFGVYGQSIDEMIADAATEIDPICNGSRPKNILVMWEGTIELAGIPDAAACYAKLVQYCQARQAAGWQVVMLTILPASTVDNAERAALNTLIRNGAATYGYTVADVAANTTIGEDGDNSNLTYYLADETHMTQAGYGVVASIVATAIGTL